MAACIWAEAAFVWVSFPVRHAVSAAGIQLAMNRNISNFTLELGTVRSCADNSTLRIIFGNSKVQKQNCTHSAAGHCY